MPIVVNAKVQRPTVCNALDCLLVHSEVAGRYLERNIAHMRAMRDRLHQGLERELDGVHLNGHPELRLPNTLSIGFEGIEADTLDRVRVGEIELHQVDGMVIEGSAPREVLLGMSFLKQVEFSQRDGQLILQQAL